MYTNERSRGVNILNLVEVPAKIECIPVSLKRSIRKIIKQAIRNKGLQFNYVDSQTNISYLASMDRKEGKRVLMVSVVDQIPVPNASILPFLKTILGEPTTMHAKPWARDKDSTFFIMFWDEPSVKRLM